jgi:hypothetical protein
VKGIRENAQFVKRFFQKRTMRTALFFLAIFPHLGRPYFGTECPGHQYKNIKILWIDYTAFQIKQEANGTVSGTFPQIMKKSLKHCCPRLNYTFIKREYHSTPRQEEEVFGAMKKTNDTIFVLFPTLKNAGVSTTYSPFKFVPIKISPGPMILANKESFNLHSDSLFVLQMWANPAFYLILAMSILTGVVFWILVSTSNLWSA